MVTVNAYSNRGSLHQHSIASETIIEILSLVFAQKFVVVIQAVFVLYNLRIIIQI